MITINDIINSMIREITRCVPEVEHYKGKIEEGFKRPSFLYLPVFNGNGRHNAFFKDATVEIQAVYFGKTDGYGTVDFDEKMKTAEKVREFLDTYQLQVKNRKLHFSYEMREADEQLTFYLKTQFMEDAPTPEFLEGQEQEPAEEVEFTERVK